jgi:hypothetical protein
MNAITTKTVTTQDTGETIDGATVLGDYHENGGYDWMELIGEHGWAVHMEVQVPGSGQIRHILAASEQPSRQTSVPSHVSVVALS